MMKSTQKKRDLRSYLAPESELVLLPLGEALCQTSGNLPGVDEEDAGIGSWGA